jgi:cell division protein FtsI/penicillin-binding protein 2
MQPHLVQSYSVNGNTTVIPPTDLDVIFHHQAAGEACEALVPGYDVAAKTGDAGIFNSADPNSTQVIVYAVAYGPVGESDPARRFVVLIELKDPNIHWGSETAAPGVSNILRQLFQRYGLQPDSKSTQPKQACQGPNSPAL